MATNTIVWVVFWIVISLSLLCDLLIMNKRKGAVTLKEAIKMVCVWVSVALIFDIFIYQMLGQQKALEYLTGYLVEYSLSIDNMFVFLIIFAHFAIAKELQPKVLICGILGAIVLRFIFIFIGIQLIESFIWTIYVFGAILIFTGIKMLKNSSKEESFNEGFALKILKKIFRFSSNQNNTTFFTRENGLLCATQLFAAAFVTNIADIIFAVDSIPAVLSITTDTFIVYSSNIFAILGLRSLYFLLAGLADKFALLKYGIALILFFVGFKMLISHYIHINAQISLSIIISILAISVVVSLIASKKKNV
jgi:tellurite resistance protein TerC